MSKIILSLAAIYCAGSAGIVFQKEDITATIIACDTLEIRGVYCFVNRDTATVSTVVYYPFPVDSLLNYPCSVSVVRLLNGRPLSFSLKKKGISWQQNIPPCSTDSVQVVYRQKTVKNSGRYILTTTRYWNRPLEQADFTVITPVDITLSYWSFQVDSVSMGKDRIWYRTYKRNFLPVSDMLLEWNCE